MKIKAVQNFAWLSLSVNIAYGVYNAVIGFATYSWWFITLSAYFIVLSVMRFCVLLIKRKTDNDISAGRFVQRFVGSMLIVLSVCLAGTVVLSVAENRSAKYHEIIMITIATYTFVKVTLGIINLIKARKKDLPTVKALRSISFCDAFVCVFSMQRSMLISFPGMTESEIKIFNILTGSAVCILVFISGINLIGGRLYNMAKSKIVKANEKIAETVVGGYKKIENAVVEGYSKVEQAVTDGYTKIEDKFVEKYLTHDDETVEQAKERLKKESK